MVSKILVVALGALTLLAPGPALGQPRPVIERIEPTSGPPGTQVEIIGRRIHPHSRILLGSAELSVLRRLPNRWTARIPDGAASGNLVVETRWGSYRGPYFRVTAARPAPVAERIVPEQGPPGTEVTIHGQSFSPRPGDNAVTLSGRPVVVRSATPTTLDVIVPTGAGSGPFVVRVEQAGETRTGTFTVTAGTAITDFQPRLGPPGTHVTLTGTGFSRTRSHNRVFLNNLPVRVERARETELVVTLPARAATGHILVDVRGSGRAQTPEPFRIQYPPTVARFAPSAGPPGSAVVIEGNHFGTDPRDVRVTLAGRPVVLRSVSPRRIQVEVPAGAATGKLAVTVSGLGPAESSGDFRVLAPVAIAGFTPRSGPAEAVVTITGQGFSATLADNTVTIGNARAQVLSASETELRVRVPSTSSGTIQVTVAGSGSARTSVPFLVTEPPFVAGFAPAAGPPGTDITIRGRNFGTNQALVRVTLNGRPLAIRSLADDRIVATVPDGATTGRIGVSVRLQGSGSASADFQVTAAGAPEPPAAGLAVTDIEAECTRPGCHAVLRGRGFSTRVRFNRVFFGTRPVRVEGATATELRIALPAAPGTHPFRVDVRNGGEAQSAPFTITR